MGNIGDNGKEHENYYSGVGCRELKQTLEPDKGTSNPIRGFYCYSYYYYSYYYDYSFIHGQPFSSPRLAGFEIHWPQHHCLGLSAAVPGRFRV